MGVKPPLVRRRTLWETKGAAMNQDPVCGMAIEPSEAAGRSEFEGKTFYFCCPACKSQFDADPRLFSESRPRIPCCGFGGGVVRRTIQRGSA